VESRVGITVTGVGVVAATPDEADIAFGVEAQAVNAQEALSRNGLAARRLISALKEAGVADADLRTEQVTVHPHHGQEGKLTGFTARNAVRATLRDLESAGAVVEAAVTAGATDVHGPFVAVSNQDELYRSAFEAAFADARAKAEGLAVLAGVGLGPVAAIVEGGAGAQPFFARAETLAAAPPIEAGTQEIRASLTITFAIAG
jgi:uncharacterized protein YggE